MSYRTAFITGASGGIGEALARRLAAAGVEVGIAARRAQSLEAIAADIRRSGGNASTYPLDVTDVEDTTRTLLRADDEMGGIDLLIANAGVGKERWAGKLRWNDCEPLLSVNVIGATATLTALVSRMAARRRGHLVGVSSLAQYRGMPRNAVYSATKAYLSTFLEGLRIDLRSVGVSVTDVRPGFVRTDLTAKNEFRMPFLLEADAASKIIIRSIQRKEAVVAFPWQLAAVMRATTVLPASLWDQAINKGRGR